MDQNVTPQLTRLQEPWESPGWRCCNHAQKSTPCRWKRVLCPNVSTASGSALVQFWMKVYLADKCQNLQTLDKYGYNTESYTHNMNYLIAKTGLIIMIKKQLGIRVSLYSLQDLWCRQNSSGSLRPGSSTLPFNSCCIWGFMNALQNSLLCNNEVGCNWCCKISKKSNLQSE